MAGVNRNIKREATEASLFFLNKTKHCSLLNGIKKAGLEWTKSGKEEEKREENNRKREERKEENKIEIEDRA